MGNKPTKEIEWLLDTLWKEFDVEVAAEDIAVEAAELGLEEVEDFFVPIEVIDNLPETLLYELMIVDVGKGTEWVGAIAFYPNSPEWCLQVITKNGETVYRNPLPYFHE